MISGSIDVAMRKILPTKVKVWYGHTPLYIQHRARVSHVYHCTVHKAGSQWIRGIFADPITNRYSDLTSFTYRTSLYRIHNGVSNKEFGENFPPSLPERAIVTPLYCDFNGFSSIAEEQDYRALFVMRDPRDIVVSWYFSARYSHPIMGRISEYRERLNKLAISDGLKYSIEQLDDIGVFNALREWATNGIQDPRVMIARYEDLASSDCFPHFRAAFDHCDIRVPDKLLRILITEHSFEQLSGRRPGEQDVGAHLRKGVAGDWANYFDGGISQTFEAVTGDLIEALGYQ